MDFNYCGEYFTGNGGKSYYTQLVLSNALE